MSCISEWQNDLIHILEQSVKIQCQASRFMTHARTLSISFTKQTVSVGFQRKKPRTLCFSRGLFKFPFAVDPTFLDKDHQYDCIRRTTLHNIPFLHF